MHYTYFLYTRNVYLPIWLCTDKQQRRTQTTPMKPKSRLYSTREHPRSMK